jgi:hypothetical protein
MEVVSFMSGPPLVVHVYWYNRRHDLIGTRGYCCSIAASAFVDLTEYLRRVGEFLIAHGHVSKIMALNEILYSVNVIVATKLSTGEIGDLLQEYCLAPAN